VGGGGLGGTGKKLGLLRTRRGHGKLLGEEGEGNAALLGVVAILGIHLMRLQPLGMAEERSNLADRGEFDGGNIAGPVTGNGSPTLEWAERMSTGIDTLTRSSTAASK
jgi:hypothetical protein